MKRRSYREKGQNVPTEGLKQGVTEGAKETMEGEEVGITSESEARKVGKRVGQGAGTTVGGTIGTAIAGSSIGIGTPAIPVASTIGGKLGKSIGGEIGVQVYQEAQDRGIKLTADEFKQKVSKSVKEQIDRQEIEDKVKEQISELGSDKNSKETGGMIQKARQYAENDDQKAKDEAYNMGYDKGEVAGKVQYDAGVESVSKAFSNFKENYIQTAEYNNFVEPDLRALAGFKDPMGVGTYRKPPNDQARHLLDELYDEFWNGVYVSIEDAYENPNR